MNMTKIAFPLAALIVGGALGYCLKPSPPAEKNQSVENERREEISPRPEDNSMRVLRARIRELEAKLAEKNPKAAEWVREGGLFFLVSNLITIIRGIMVTLLEPVFSFLGSGSVGFPNLTLNLFGIEFSWYIIGASESQGGAAYFTSFLIALWVCEIINFFMQRSFVFRSNGKMGRQALLYFLAFAVVTCIVNAVSNIWIGVASHFVPPLVYNLGTTFITGGVAMVVFFFANKLIFDSTLEKSEENHEEQNEEQVEDKI